MGEPGLRSKAAFKRLVTERTRLINQARYFLMKRGIRVRTGRHVFQEELMRLAAAGIVDLSNRSNRSCRMRRLKQTRSAAGLTPSALR